MCKGGNGEIFFFYLSNLVNLDGTSWDRIGRDGIGWDVDGMDGMGWDGMDGMWWMGWDGKKSCSQPASHAIKPQERISCPTDRRSMLLREKL